jgi:hypothetical protein
VGLALFNPRRPALPADLSPLSKPRGQSALPIPYAPMVIANEWHAPKRLSVGFFSIPPETRTAFTVHLAGR